MASVSLDSRLSSTMTAYGRMANPAARGPWRSSRTCAPAALDGQAWPSVGNSRALAVFGAPRNERRFRLPPEWGDGDSTPGRDGSLPCAFLTIIRALATGSGPRAAPAVRAPDRPPSSMTTTDAPISTELLPRLRRCTAPLHDEIEALLRLGAPMPLARYGRILRGFHEFLQLWEQRVRHALPESLRPWFDARRRAPFAAHD